MLRFCSAAAIAFLLGACAQGSASETITPQQTAAIQATCTRIMRLRQGEAEFDGCVSDLSNTVAWEISNARAAHAYGDCAALGLKRKSLEFSRCVLDRENAPPAAEPPASQAAAPLNVADVKPADADPDGYFRAGFALRRRREQFACAQMGLEPGSTPFVDCVDGLEIDLFNIANPHG